MTNPTTTSPTDQQAVNPFVRVALPHGLSRWIPAFAALKTYQRSWITKDLVAGLVLTAILVPVGMGYAEAAGLPAIYGLYATIVPLIAYAIFGPSRILVLGPDSSLAAVIAAPIVPLAAGDPDRLVALAKAGFTHAYNIIDGFEGDKVEDPESVHHGKRMRNGWKNSAPWTYQLDPKLVWLPSEVELETLRSTLDL